MIKVIVSGCYGRMGRVVGGMCEKDPDVIAVAGFDVVGQGELPFPVFSNPALCTVDADVVIDFSSPSALSGLLGFSQKNHTALILAATGYSDSQLEEIETASHVIPIFRSANMSLGINILIDLIKKAAAVLGQDYDIEIVERHHNRKLDAPSGTALMLADAASSALPNEMEYVYERQSVRKPREKREIGISAVRGGTIVGDHTVIFAGQDEVIELTHHAASREIFASGALRAAKFMASVLQPGLYDMSDVINNS